MLKISRKNIWKETVVPYVIDNIIIHMNPEGDSGGGDGERESCDTEDRSDSSSSEDMDL